MKQRLDLGDTVIQGAVRRVETDCLIPGRPGQASPESAPPESAPAELRMNQSAASALTPAELRMNQSAAPAPARSVLLAGRNDTAADDGGPPRLRCASLLKPLLFWVAAKQPGFQLDVDRWRTLAAPAITRSANEPTLALWEAVGAAALLDGIEAVTGVRWTVEAGGRSFGRVLVRADEVVTAYAELVRAAPDDGAAAQVLAWMQAVVPQQTFGLREVVAGSVGTTDSSVALKCGWFSDADEHHIRTHAVTITGSNSNSDSDPARLTAQPDRPVADAVVVACVLTALPTSPLDRATYAAADAAGTELAIHEAFAGAILRSRVRSLLSE